MRWITFAILFYIFSAFQSVHFGSLGGVASYPRLEYLPLLAIFYGLYAPEESAPLAGLWCGIMYDFLTPATLGVHAVPLALVTLAVLKIRLNIFREHLISQLVITVFAVIIFGVLTTVLRFLLLKLQGMPLDALASWSHIAEMAANALYTGILAPGIYWLLFRFPSFLGFGNHRPRSGSSWRNG